MGNCLRHENEAQWGGEDWGEVIMMTKQQRSAMKAEEEAVAIVMGLTAGMDYSNSAGSFSTAGRTTTRTKLTKTTEVKIKISRKKLEQLQGRFDDIEKQDGLSVQQALAQLIKLSSHYETHQRSGWRPKLQSIPEVY